jgi:hypothetical protein
VNPVSGCLAKSDHWSARFFRSVRPDVVFSIVGTMMPEPARESASSSTSGGGWASRAVPIARQSKDSSPTPPRRWQLTQYPVDPPMDNVRSGHGNSLPSTISSGGGAIELCGGCKAV